MDTISYEFYFPKNSPFVFFDGDFDVRKIRSS